MKKYFLYAIIAVGLIVFGLSYLPSLKPKQSPINNTPPQNITADQESSSPNYKIVSSSIGAVQDSDQTQSQSQTQTGSPAPEASSSQSVILIALKVRTQNYSVEISKNGTVLDAMKAAAQKSFSFKSTKSSSLGEYVTEINGVKSTSKAFWIFYVNGAEANLGITNFKLNAGDTVVWKLEDSNKKEIL